MLNPVTNIAKWRNPHGSTCDVKICSVISSRKLKIVLDLIRNKPANVAMGILNNTPKAASEYLTKLLASAIANAENNHDMDKNKLYVAECYATQGPTLKRIQPHAQGRAFKILKRTSHITLVLKEMED